MPPFRLLQLSRVSPNKLQAIQSGGKFEVILKGIANAESGFFDIKVAAYVAQAATPVLAVPVNVNIDPEDIAKLSSLGVELRRFTPQ